MANEVKYLQSSFSMSRTRSSNLATIFRPCLKAVVSTSSSRLANSIDWADRVFRALSADNPCSCSVRSSSAKRAKNKTRILCTEKTAKKYFWNLRSNNSTFTITPFTRKLSLQLLDFVSSMTIFRFRSKLHEFSCI